MNLSNFQVDSCIVYIKKKQTNAIFTLIKVYYTIKTLLHTHKHIPISSKHT